MTKDEFSVWNETQKLMNSKNICYNKIFLDKLSSDDNSLIETLSKYKFVSKLIPKKSTILEINCERGFGAPILGEMAEEYLGIDSNYELINDAKKTNLNEKFRFSVDMNFDSNFDVIVDLNSSHSIETIENYDFDQINMSLKKDGIFILGFSNKTKNYSLTMLNNLHESFLKKINKYFHFNLKFKSQNKFITSGFSIDANYLISICFEKKGKI